MIKKERQKYEESKETFDYGHGISNGILHVHDSIRTGCRYWKRRKWNNYREQCIKRCNLYTL